MKSIDAEEGWCHCPKAHRCVGPPPRCRLPLARFGRGDRRATPRADLPSGCRTSGRKTRLTLAEKALQRRRIPPPRPPPFTNPSPIAAYYTSPIRAWIAESGTLNQNGHHLTSLPPLPLSGPLPLPEDWIELTTSSQTEEEEMGAERGSVELGCPFGSPVLQKGTRYEYAEVLVRFP